MNDIYITLCGNVAAEPRQYRFDDGMCVTSLRLATTPRVFDRASQSWHDGETSFYAVRCYRALADNVARSVRQGQPIVVHGKLRIRSYEREGERRFMAEVEAVSVGHDLRRGVTTFHKPQRVSPPAFDELAREKLVSTTRDWESVGSAAALRGSPDGSPTALAAAAIDQAGTDPGRSQPSMAFTPDTSGFASPPGLVTDASAVDRPPAATADAGASRSFPAGPTAAPSAESFGSLTGPPPEVSPPARATAEAEPVASDVATPAQRRRGSSRKSLAAVTSSEADSTDGKPEGDDSPPEGSPGGAGASQAESPDIGLALTGAGHALPAEAAVAFAGAEAGHVLGSDTAVAFAGAVAGHVLGADTAVAFAGAEAGHALAAETGAGFARAELEHPLAGSDENLPVAGPPSGINAVGKRRRAALRPPQEGVRRLAA